MITIKTPEDIQKIKEACRIWKHTRKVLQDFVKVGVSLKEIDLKAKETIEAEGGKPAFYDYHGFPSNICLSVNDLLIHGTATDYVLKDGDLITLDVGVVYDGHFCDSAYTIIVGNASPEAMQINEVCYNSLMEAIKIIKPNETTNFDIAETVQDYVESNGYEVIRDFTGHGCGNELHEDPIIANYRCNFFRKQILKPGMVICIEPMIMTESNKYIVDKTNNWSVYAKNKKLTCHWEHMIWIKEDGVEVLTE